MAYCGVPESPIVCLHALLEEFNQRVTQQGVAFNQQKIVN